MKLCMAVLYAGAVLDWTTTTLCLLMGLSRWLQPAYLHPSSTGPTRALLGAERARTATIQSTEHVTVQFKIVEIGEKSFRWTNIQLHMNTNR